MEVCSRKKMVLGLLQTECILGDREHNLKTAKKMFLEAAGKGANFIVLPELFYEGYDARLYVAEKIEETAQRNLEMIEVFKALCQEKAVYAVVPFVEKADGKYYNALTFIDDAGRVVRTYQKAHLWDADKICFSPGDKGPGLVDTPFGKIALMICYDIDFPEMARYAALNGAEIVVLPVAWDFIHWDLYNIFTSARAADNMMYVCTANIFEKTETSYLFGGSRVVNPRGTPIAQLPICEGGMIIQEVDLAKVYEYRKAFPYLTDRQLTFNF